MDCRPPREPRMTRARARRPERRIRRALTLVACALFAVSPAPCDEHVLVGGLFDAEFWKTDDGSRLLSRNDGEAAPGGRLRLWVASEFRPRLQGFVRGEVFGGKADIEHGTETELEQAFVRYSFKDPRRLVIEAGRLLSPI